MRATAPLAWALAAFFVVVQFYTSLAALSPTPPVGYVFVSRAGAAALVAILALAALFILLRLWRDRAFSFGASPAMLFAWLGAVALATAFGIDPVSGVQVLGIMLLAATFHMGFVRYYAGPPVGRVLIVAYLSAGTIAALAALAMLALHRPAELYAYNNGRAAGTFVTANQCAAFLLLFGFVAFGVARSAQRRALQTLAWSATSLAALALVLTYSRSGWIAAGAGAVFLAATLRGRRVALVLGALLLAVGLALALRPVARHDSADSFNRVATLVAGARVAELFPLTGAGPMAYWRVYPQVRTPNGAQPGAFGALHPHDIYLSLAGELGVAGVVATALGWLAFARAFRRSLLGLAPAGRPFALAIAAGLIATLVQGLFDTIGVVEMSFVWIPYTALALAAARFGPVFE
jgi:O-antigen ligase